MPQSGSDHTGSNRVALYPSVGPELTQYDVNIDGADLVKMLATRPCFGWAWSHPGASRGDEAVDPAVAEQPIPAFFGHLVVIGAARADFWPLRTGLHQGPVGA